MSEFTHRLPHQPWSKPSRNEREYFQRQAFHQRMAVARRREQVRDASERDRVLERLRDHCPKCGAPLERIRVADGQADQCPNCLGVWLDHETFDRMTQPEPESNYLTETLREVLLQYSTGKIPVKRHEPPGHGRPAHGIPARSEPSSPGREPTRS